MAPTRPEPLPPIVVIAGDDELSKREALGAIRERFRDAETGDEIVFDGGRDPVELGAAVFEELRTRPFDGGPKLVVVRSADEFAKKHKDALIAYFSRPASFSQLVLVIRTLGGGRNTFRDLLKKARAYNAFAKPADKVAPWVRDRRADDTDLKRWIVQRARSRRLQLDAGVAESLAARLGANLEEIDALLARWAFMQVKRVTAVELVAVEQRHRRTDTFSLADAVFRRDAKGAMEILACLLDEGIEMSGKRITMAGDLLPLLTGLFLRKYRQLVRASAHLAAGGGRQSLIDTLGIKSFLLDDTMETLKRYPPAALRYGIARLVEADRAVKLARQRPDAALIDLVLDLIRGAPANPHARSIAEAIR